MHTVLRWWRKDAVVTQGQCISSEPISENKNLVQSKKKKNKKLSGGSVTNSI